MYCLYSILYINIYLLEYFFFFFYNYFKRSININWGQSICIEAQYRWGIDLKRRGQRLNAPEFEKTSL